VLVDLRFQPRPQAGAFDIPILLLAAFDVEQELESPPDSHFGLLGIDAVEERFRFCSSHAPYCITPETDWSQESSLTG
jgi:hypothetical protein